ncbi:hypothetical protein CcaverHIS002_0109120 [Cutaneotrichosporon cavernicola]|uniref:Phosphatidylinositol transfer protein SFH5 n=1 Tax=Cutaneotrichosporon cavernicola TaxID=279322 RepID=A0AA48IC80_9TREE|nr:uncharacterized protein CcaverHIS019_0109040 [Cutaneotrichosporon cavernicola]BEI80383.1 hypothetical protein CcaverHIS002_0109120 [Cutaneotrichosporon cavernicola]BEI88186.1 hypothetical protein CcaverHIS019_0109040 [Cutaneotrichosporon cavernicola]BEI95958.1 hypothetical protein CcaverHIS631_0109070 [Cutaneotrichosporon cavernicola]
MASPLEPSPIASTNGQATWTTAGATDTGPALSALEVVNPPSAAEAAAASADATSSPPDAEPEGPEITIEGWGTLKPSHPLIKFHKRLPAIVEASRHRLIWGVTLNPTTPTFSTMLILQKWLRSVAGDLDAAAAALESTLTWRREFGLDGAKPIWEETFEGFDGLGYVTHLSSGEVVTWNLYGSIKNLGETFGDLDKFMRWRIGLMERAMSHLDLAHTTKGIPDVGAGPDPHRLLQVHVYTGVSFLRLDSRVKTASKKAIEVMAAHYPETLARKFFVGVPVLMSWVFAAVRVFVNAETARKFVVVSYEETVASEMGDKGVPKRFGGSAGELDELDRKAQAEADKLATKVPEPPHEA